MTNKTLEAALHYYSVMGFSVIPVAPRAKHPLAIEGIYDILNDESGVTRTWNIWGDYRASVKQIEWWWERVPDANVAIMTGVLSDILIVDIDSPNGHDVIKDLLAQDGVDMDAIPSVQTVRGLHLYFAYPDGYLLHNAGKPFDGFDLRGIGGYALLPPSTHPTGVEYKWIGQAASKFERLRVPQQLLEYILARVDYTTVERFEDGSDDNYEEEEDDDDDYFYDHDYFNDEDDDDDFDQDDPDEDEEQGEEISF